MTGLAVVFGFLHLHRLLVFLLFGLLDSWCHFRRVDDGVLVTARTEGEEEEGFICVNPENEVLGFQDEGFSFVWILCTSLNSSS